MLFLLIEKMMVLYYIQEKVDIAPLELLMLKMKLENILWKLFMKDLKKEII